MRYFIRVDVKQYRYFIFAVLCLGFGGIVAQTVLLRELLVLFSGNEFSIGVIIGSWVVAEAAGALAAGRWGSLFRGRPPVFIALTALFCVIFPASVYLARAWRVLAGIAPETGVGLLQIIYCSTLILLPAGFLHGFLFVSACSLSYSLTGERLHSAGRVYYYETLGTMAGGIAASYVLIPRINSFETALLTAVLLAASCVMLARAFRMPAGRFTSFAALLFLAAACVLSATDLSGNLQASSIARQWRGRDVVGYRNSFYENITVVREAEQYTFYTDGVPLITTPVPDVASVEEFVHFPMLMNPAPKDVLVLSGGAGGVINELLKYPSVERIDYVEIDPELLSTIRAFPTPLTKKELGDPRVRLHYVDGRVFVRDAPVKYDVVLLGLDSPQTLETNRYFTTEFFRMLRGVMKPDGLFAMTAPGSPAYYNAELKSLNAGMLRTLDSVFPAKFVIPGDTNIFIAGNSPGLAATTPATLSERLLVLKLPVSLITPQHIAWRLDSRMRGWFRGTVEQAKASVNRDFDPSGMLHGTAYRNLIFNPWLNRVFGYAEGAKLWGVLAAGAALFIVLLPLCLLRKSAAIPAAMAATGFSAMAVELILIMGFQIFYGRVFMAVGLLMAAFMGGIAAGSRAVSAVRPANDEYRLFMRVDFALAALPVLLLALFMVLDPAALSGRYYIYALFVALLFASGFLTGMQFPLANRLYIAREEARRAGESSQRRRGEVESAAGMVYGADLIGGWAGGVLGGFLLIPAIGLLNGLVMLAGIKAMSFALLAVTKGRK